MGQAIKLCYVPREGALPQIMGCLDSGAHVALFALRAQGKTAFLRYELLPAALRAGWFAARIDLHGSSTDPMIGLVRGLELAAGVLASPMVTNESCRGGVAHAWPRLGWPVVELADGALPGYVPLGSEDSSLAHRLSHAMKLIAKRPGRSIILLEGFSAAALNDVNQCVPVFRELLLDLRAHVAFLFAESSRTALVEMFLSARSPLFGVAQTVKLEPLSRSYLLSRADFILEQSGMEVDQAQLYRAFQRLCFVPAFLDEVIMDAVVRGKVDMELGVARWELAAAGSAAVALHRLNPLELALMTWLALPGAKAVYGMPARRALAAMSGAEVMPSATRVQAAIRSLLRLGLIEATGPAGSYHIPDPALAIAMGAIALGGAMSQMDISPVATPNRGASWDS